MPDINLNPHRKNQRLVSSIFSKPITLITALAFFFFGAISLIFVFSYNLIIAGCMAASAFDLALSFFYLFISSKAKKANSFFPLAIIGILLSIGTIAVYFSGVIFSFLGILNPASVEPSTIITPSSAILTIVVAISLIVFFTSINKSMTSIYIIRKGTVITAVLSFILAGLLIGQGLIENDLIYVAYRFIIQNAPVVEFAKASPLLLAFAFTHAFAYIMLGFTALFYHSKVKKITEGFTSTRAKKVQADKKENHALTSETPDIQKVDIEEAASFEPQHVVFDSHLYDEAPDKADTPVTAPVIISRLCKNCGADVPNGDNFCGKCGTPYTE